MDEMKKAQDEMKELGKRSNISKTKPWIHRKRFGKEGKELDEKHENLKNQCNELYKNSLKSEYLYNK